MFICLRLPNDAVNGSDYKALSDKLNELQRSQMEEDINPASAWRG